MIVLLVMPLADLRGGAEVALMNLLRESRGMGLKWIVTFLADGPMVRGARDLGIETAVIPAGRLRQPLKFARCVVRVARAIRDHQVDLVLSWMGKAHLYGGPAALLAGVPACWFQHGMPSPRCMMDRLATLIPARAVLTCSKAVADVQDRIRPSRPTRVVYPGVDLERFDPRRLPSPAEARRRLGLPGSGPVIGMVARLQRWKGVHVLIEAMPAVLASHPDATCVIVGGDHALEPEYPRLLRERIDALGLAARVRLVGLQRNVPEWMQTMDVVVHASDNEPFGLVIVEAMALGKPVVATNAGGPAEIIAHNENGLLVPFGDPPALAAAICRIREDSALAGLGDAAKRRAAAFSNEVYARRLVSVLSDEIATEHRRRVPASGTAGLRVVEKPS